MEPKKSYKRSLRVRDRIREEVSELISRKVKDPRIGFVTVTEVRLTDDLRNAKIFVSVYGDEQAKKESMAGLQSSSSFIQREVWRSLEIKARPEIHFVLDESGARGAAMDETLRKLKEDGEL